MGVAFFTLFFVPLIFAPNLTDSLELPKLAALLISLAVGLFIITKRGTPVTYHKTLYIVFGLFILQALISAIFSWDIGTSLFGLYTRWTSSVLFYGIWIFSIIIFIQAIDTDDKYWFLFRTSIATAFAVSLFAIAQYFGFAFYVGLDAPVRSLIPSFLGNPNFSAMYVAAILPAAIWAYSRSTATASRLYYFAVLGSSVVAIGLFNSRGAIAAVVVSGAMLVLGGLVQGNRRRLAAVSAVVTVVMIAVFSLLFAANRPMVLQRTIALSGAEITPRIQVVQRSWEFIKDSPLVGVGLGNFYLAYEKFLNINTVNYENFDDAHNIFLHLAVNGGIPLLILYLIIILMALRWGWTLWRRTGNTIYLVILSAIVSWHISAAFNPVVIPCWVLLAFLLAGIYRHHTFLAILLPAPVRYASRLKALLFIAIAVAIILNDYLSLFPGNFYYSKQYDKTIRYARAAVILNPLNNGVMRYWIRSRMQLGQDPAQTARLIDFYYKTHPLSSRTDWNASVLYYNLYHQTNNPQDLQSAYDYGDKAIQRAPDFAALYFYASYIRYQQKDYLNATRYLDKAIAVKSDELSYWSLRAMIAKETGDRAGVIAALEQAQKIQFTSPAYKQVLERAKAEPDVSKIQIPIQFAEPDI